MALEERDGELGKVCRACGEWQPVTAFRKRAALFGDGYYNQCRACERAADQARRVVNPQAEREKVRKYRQKNRDALLEDQRTRRAENPEPHRERARRWKQENPEATQQSRDKWRAANQEKEREQIRRWRQNNREQAREQGRRRRVRKSATAGSHTPAEWEALKAAHNYTCVRCGRREPQIKLERDHIIPLGQPGSSDSIDNIQPLCRTCNAGKGTRNEDFRGGGGALR